jgi:hypothetical protein
LIQIVEKIKKFFGSAGKLVLALFFAGVGLFAVVEIYSTTTAFFEEKSLEKYAVAEPWAYDLPQIGFKVEGKRKYVDGALLVTLKFTGYPKFLSDPALNRKNKEESRGFLLSFQDSDEFDVFELNIPLTSLTTILGEDGKPIGLSGQHAEFISAETYARISKAELVWTLDTEIAKPVAQKPHAVSNTVDSGEGDHCAPGISRSARLKRLAQHGDVRLTGADTYKAGSSTVMFGFDGGVIYCD